MPALTGTAALPLQLEDVNDIIPVIFERSKKLASRIKDNGRSKRVSLKNFRVRMNVADIGDVAKINLDGGVLPGGSALQWDQGLVTPLAFAVPIQYTRLSDLVGEPKDVSSQNPVSATIARAMDALQKKLDMFLQTNNDGKLAQVLSTYAGGGANPITLEPSPWGARLLEKGQKVQVMSNAYVLRGSATITNVVKAMGGTQSITVDAVPGGTVAGDFIMVNGVEATTPVFIQGIPYFMSTATTGTFMGISRANSYVVANGVGINNGQVSLPVLDLAIHQIEVELGEEALKNQVWHTHPSQVAAYKELGFNMQAMMLGKDGKAEGSFDPMIADRKVAIEGREVISNLHADNTRWDCLFLPSWGKVVWGNPPFWFKNRAGQTVFQQYDTSSGNPTTTELTYLVWAGQFYVDNPKASTSVTSAKLPTGN